ncbi:hypothetical protein [Plantactinospora sp. KLBMP9567]|uniref:hypothetical protein n=1 Tax=Plantactinospora sp. KLBMP9567 TaxID=3085900 RepID=UPI0029829405|nr:hypothetical protein [Plantactinospora sp. KLBMP9567]MDW5329249.1 hypothetical protein [Plantactinospora sp. KLBMP9567]
MTRAATVPPPASTAPAPTETLRGWFLGLAIAVALGVLVGFDLGTVPVLREFTASTVEFLRPIRSVALIPLAVLLFGTDLLGVAVNVLARQLERAVLSWHPSVRGGGTR